MTPESINPDETVAFGADVWVAILTDEVQDLLLFGRHSCVNGFGDGRWCHDVIPCFPWSSAP